MKERVRPSSRAKAEARRAELVQRALDRGATETRPGFCLCGCGLMAPVAKKTFAEQGMIKGRPQLYRRGHAARLQTPEYHLEDRGYTSPCWVWDRARIWSGYGKACRPGKPSLSAHRLYWEELRGPIPDGLTVDHLCKQHDCVNPDHFELVTDVENIRRRDSCKLSLVKAEEIRRSNEPHRVLAERYGVHRHTIYNVRSGRTWQPA